MFAFASVGGVEAFFNVITVADMLRQHSPLHLVVGVDAITNAEALLSIESKRNSFPRALTAEIFFHEYPASTFHPKFVWFRRGEEVRLITGSGNLTTRGLGVASPHPQAPGNWEAFSFQVLRGAAARTVLDGMSAWVAAQRVSRNLRESPNDEQSQSTGDGERFNALFNCANYRSERYELQCPYRLNDEPIDIQDILVRELPRNRPGQADVGKTALTEFFGFAGASKDILLQYVSLNNQLGETERIRLFTNVSQNYRLELHAMDGLPYEVGIDDGRLLLVATKLDRRSFRYTVIPVDVPAHGQLSHMLGDIRLGRRLMREMRVTSEVLLASWSTAPTNLLPVVLPTLPQ